MSKEEGKLYKNLWEKYSEKNEKTENKVLINLNLILLLTYINLGENFKGQFIQHFEMRRNSGCLMSLCNLAKNNRRKSTTAGSARPSRRLRCTVAERILILHGLQASCNLLK